MPIAVQVIENQFSKNKTYDTSRSNQHSSCLTQNVGRQFHVEETKENGQVTHMLF